MPIDFNLMKTQEAKNPVDFWQGVIDRNDKLNENAMKHFESSRDAYLQDNQAANTLKQRQAELANTKFEFTRTFGLDEKRLASTEAQNAVVNANQSRQTDIQEGNMLINKGNMEINAQSNKDLAAYRSASLEQTGRGQDMTYDIGRRTLESNEGIAQSKFGLELSKESRARRKEDYEVEINKAVSEAMQRGDLKAA